MLDSGVHGVYVEAISAGFQRQSLYTTIESMRRRFGELLFDRNVKDDIKILIFDNV